MDDSVIVACVAFLLGLIFWPLVVAIIAMWRR